MLKLDKIQANKIVEKLMADIPYNINIMDERGKIIASGDSARIGERHRGAERAINERKNIEIYKDTSLEKKGTNEPIILNNHILGVVGISGEPDEVRKFTKLVRSIVLLLTEELNTQQEREKKKKQKKNKKIIWIGIAVAIGFIVYIDLAEKDDYWDYSASSEDVYPLKEAGLTTTGPVDLEKPLKVTIEQNKLLFNQGYQIEIIGDADIETSGGKNFLILPSTEEYPDTKYLGNISFYEKRDYYTSAGMYLSGNLVNSLSDYLDTSKEFIKAYPIDKIADVQTGYILKRNQGYTDISKYYLFKDGTGFELEVSVDQLEKVKDPKDYSSFVKTYAKEVAFIEKSFKFESTDEESR